MWKAILIYAISTLGLSATANNSSIIIIGAGSAGIAAATRLLENRFTNILILEAEPRIGGRINSVKFGDAYVDLGAEWCHGQKNNIVYETVKEFNVLGYTDYSTKLHHSSRKDIGDDFSKDLWEIGESFYKDLDKYNISDDVTVGDFFIEMHNKTVYERYGHDKEKLEIALSAIDMFEHYVQSMEGAFSWLDPVMKSDYKASDNIDLPWDGHGYKIFLDILMKKYPNPKNQLPIDDKILLNKEVVNIHWDAYAESKAVTITCSDRSVYKADNVIFTASIGVLKERSHQMFLPNLPVEKLEAIKNIGFGAVMKVVMRFPTHWWNNSNSFNFLWSQEDIRSALWEFPEGPNWNGRSWVTDMSFLVAVNRNPNVLIAWFTGQLVPVIELLPRRTLVNGLYFIMNKFLGHLYKISKPEEIIRTQWYSNPHFRGTYSFQTVVSKKGNKKSSAEEDLLIPIENYKGQPIVQFAGEATHPYHYSTVHGATESGYREANRLITFYKDK